MPRFSNIVSAALLAGLATASPTWDNKYDPDCTTTKKPVYSSTCKASTLTSTYTAYIWQTKYSAYPTTVTVTQAQQVPTTVKQVVYSTVYSTVTGGVTTKYQTVYGPASTVTSYQTVPGAATTVTVIKQAPASTCPSAGTVTQTVPLTIVRPVVASTVTVTAPGATVTQAGSNTTVTQTAAVNTVTVTGAGSTVTQSGIATTVTITGAASTVTLPGSAVTKTQISTISACPSSSIVSPVTTSSSSFSSSATTTTTSSSKTTDKPVTTSSIPGYPVTTPPATSTSCTTSSSASTKSGMTTTTSAHESCATTPEDGTYCGFINPEDPCAPQPGGHGPVPTPDTASAFRAYPAFHSMATALPSAVPAAKSGSYKKVFNDLNKSVGANKYLGLHTLTSYDASACAAKCDAEAGCKGFNLFIERDPSVNPTNNDSDAPTVWGYYCPNPASITNYQCTLWGVSLCADDAKNAGGWRKDFEVVIAGSVGYSL